MKMFQFALALVLMMCLLDKPAHFYFYVHAVSAILFALMAFNAYDSYQKKKAILFFSLALFIQPVYPLPFDRSIWIFIEIVFALILLISACRTNKD